MVKVTAEVKLCQFEGVCEAVCGSHPGAGFFAPTNAVSSANAL